MGSATLDRPRARLGLAVVLLAVLGFGTGCDGASAPGAGQPSVSTPGIAASQHPPAQSLILSCQRTPCPHGQEFEIFDRSGAPILSVGEFGGASVFGDNVRVWAPGTSLLTGTAAVTLSWESPRDYDHQFRLADGCTPPAIWESPQAIWTCTSSHTWRVDVRF